MLWLFYRSIIMQTNKRKPQKPQTQLKLKLEHLLYVHAIRKGDIGQDPYATYQEIAKQLKKEYGVNVTTGTLARRYGIFTETGVVRKGLPTVNVEERYAHFLKMNQDKLNKTDLYRPYDASINPPDVIDDVGDDDIDGDVEENTVTAKDTPVAFVSAKAKQLNEELVKNGKTTQKPSPVLTRTHLEKGNQAQEQAKNEGSFDPTQFMPQR